MWVRYEVMFGPGHQSTIKGYVHVLHEGDILDAIENKCQDWWTDPVARWEIVKKVPEKVIAEKQEWYKSRIEYIERKQKILACTPTVEADPEDGLFRDRNGDWIPEEKANEIE